MNELKYMNWKEWITKSATRRTIFLNIFKWDRAVAAVSCTFCWPHLPKSAPRPKVVFTIFMWDRALATVSCTFSRPLSHIEARNRGNRDPPAAITRTATLPQKTKGFAPESVFKREFTHALSLTLPHYLMLMMMMMMMMVMMMTMTTTTTTRMMMMMMMMMMWLPWWRGWHDGEKASHDNCP